MPSSTMPLSSASTSTPSTPSAAHTLLEAARTGNVDLLNKEAGGQDSLDKVAVEGNTVLHVASSHGHLPFVTRVLEMRSSLITATNTSKDTPLHCAARAGHEHIIDYFINLPRDIEQGNSFWEARNKAGDTALHEAIRCKHVGVVKKLVTAHPQLTSVVNNHAGISPLYLAVMVGSIDMVEAILRELGPISTQPNLAYANALWVGPNQQTALHAAVFQGPGITKMLLDEQPELALRGDSKNSLPLHYASSDGNIEIVELLLKYDPLTVQQKDENGLSPLHVAACMGHVDVMDTILKICPYYHVLIDNKGRDFLHAAIDMGRLNVVLYVKRRPVLAKMHLNWRDFEGNTPLHLAVLKQDKFIVYSLLLNKRVLGNVMNNMGLTPLDLVSISIKSGTIHGMVKIRNNLLAAGSEFSPQRQDNLNYKIQIKKPEEILKSFEALSKNLAVIDVLIATITFAAGFTLPGGYIQTDGDELGMAVLSKQVYFKVFLISDTIAMTLSMTAACLLIYVGSFDDPINQLCVVGSSLVLTWVALGAMAIAFGAGLFAVVAMHCRWLGYVVCCVTICIPLYVWVILYLTSFEPFNIKRAWMRPMTHTTRHLTRRAKRAGKFRNIRFLIVVGFVIFAILLIIRYSKSF